MRNSLLLLLFALAWYTSFGQTKGTNDLGVTIGGLTSNDIFDVSSKLIVTGTSGGSLSYGNSNAVPAIALTFKHAVADNWFFYADGVYQSIKQDVFLSGADAGEVNNSFLTFGLGTEYHYAHSNWFQMYSGASIGYTFQNSNYTGSSEDIQDDSSGYFNFQINALGFRFGKSIAVTLELGVGYKGLAILGISYQF